MPFLTDYGVQATIFQQLPRLADKKGYLPMPSRHHLNARFYPSYFSCFGQGQTFVVRLNSPKVFHLPQKPCDVRNGLDLKLWVLAARSASHL
ncbi:hypothetical protein D3C81_1779770 [compost metagenome]